MRAAVAKVAGNIEVTCTNPVYWASAYRLSSNLDDISTSLKNALGAIKALASKKVYRIDIGKDNRGKQVVVFGISPYRQKRG